MNPVLIPHDRGPGRSLTVVVSRGVPEGLVEFGQVENHQQFVRFGLRRHLFTRGHRLDAELSLGQVERQLVVPRHVLVVERVVVAEEGRANVCGGVVSTSFSVFLFRK